MPYPADPIQHYERMTPALPALAVETTRGGLHTTVLGPRLRKGRSRLLDEAANAGHTTVLGPRLRKD